MYPLDRGRPSPANLLYSQLVLLSTLEFKNFLVCLPLGASVAVLVKLPNLSELSFLE